MIKNKTKHISINLPIGLYREARKTVLYRRCNTEGEYIRALIAQHIDAEKSRGNRENN